MKLEASNSEFNEAPRGWAGPGPVRQAEPSTERLLTVEDAAIYLSIGKRKLWEITDRGDLPRVKIGRAVRYLRTDLDGYISGCRHTPGRN